MQLGTIVSSLSHIDYLGQVFGPHDIECVPRPADYAFGRFVRVVTRTPAQVGREASAQNSTANASQVFAVGLIYNTQLTPSGFDPGSPRLTSERHTTLFSPDASYERAVLIAVILLGTLAKEPQATRPMVLHGVPPLALDAGSVIETMTDEEVRAFHCFSRPERATEPALHLGYLPHLLAHRHRLVPQLILRVLEQLERLLPGQALQLAHLKQNFAWQLKVETLG